MKRRFKWGGSVLIAVSVIFIIRIGFLEGPTGLNYFEYFSKSPPAIEVNVPDRYGPLQHQQYASPPEQLSVVYANLSPLKPSLGAWSGLRSIMNRSDLPVQVIEGFQEGLLAWETLLRDDGSESKKEKLCPDSVELTDSVGQAVALPCGLILDSSITVAATPLPGPADFHFDLIGVQAPGESGPPPVILHYNVRIRGDILTKHGVIVQNTWTSVSEWGDEMRCPPQVLQNNSVLVDGLEPCIDQVGAVPAWKPQADRRRGSEKAKVWFPFVEGMPFSATIWAGWQGFHVTVNGRHVTSFEYRDGHEPAMVGKMEVQGGLRLASIVATGLPMSEQGADEPDLESLKAPPMPPKSKKLALFIGVFSSSTNFYRRMSQRKTWMQYDAVRSGDVVVRFFVGLHTQVQVNKEIWDEAQTFGDLQLLPFVENYHLITLKTAAICIFAAEHVTTEYVMKTDDDTFVRVDEVLSILRSTPSNGSFILGEVEMYSSPSRDPTSKWYITPEEYPGDHFPPWAHGPGYVFSQDIAEFVSGVSASSQLQMFKLEDVAMGIWIVEFEKSQNRSVEYVHNQKFVSDGCKSEYVTAHYQTPREMLCLWDRLQKTQLPVCCG